MPSAPCTLDYFKLGCAAGNYIVIFTSKGVRGQLLEALRRVQHAGNPLMRPITDLLESFPDEVPDTPLPNGKERFEDYCAALGDLRTLILWQGNRAHYQWYMLGDALYRLATTSGLTPTYPIDQSIFAFETAIAEAKPPESLRGLCEGFVRLAKKRRGDHDAVFAFAWKVESFAATYLTVSFDGASA